MCLNDHNYISHNFYWEYLHQFTEQFRICCHSIFLFSFKFNFIVEFDFLSETMVYNGFYSKIKWWFTLKVETDGNNCFFRMSQMTINSSPTHSHPVKLCWNITCSSLNTYIFGFVAKLWSSLDEENNFIVSFTLWVWMQKAISYHSLDILLN